MSMEDFHEETPDTKDTRRRNFRNWLRRNIGQSPETEHQVEHHDDEEDEDVEATGKPERKQPPKRRRAFRWLVSRFVTEPQLIQEKSPLVAAEKPSTSPPLETMANSFVAASENSPPPEHKPKYTVTENRSPTETPQPAEHQNPENDETRERSVVIPHSVAEESPEQAPPPSPIERQPPPAVPPPLEYAVYERAATADTASHEQVIERPNRLAAAATVGLIAENVFRRRADRNIRKETAAETSAIKKEVRANQAQVERAEHKNAQSRQRTQDMLVWQRAFESRPPVEVTSLPEKKQPTVVEQREPAANRPPLEKSPDKKSFTKENKATMPTVEKAPSRPPEAVLNLSEALSRPAAILEKQVEAAAEQNAPLEAMYERRHEVKDDPTVTGTQAAAAAAASHQSAQAAPLSASPPSTTTPPAATTTPPSVIPQPYKQAAQSGFWAALVTLAVLAVIAVIG